MAITRKLVFWSSAEFTAPTSPTDIQGSVLWNSIVFFSSTAGTYANKIWTHGNFFDGTVTDGHAHTNKANLDSINQNLSTASDVTFKSLYSTTNVKVDGIEQLKTQTTTDNSIAGYVNFYSKNDGLYQKIGAVETKLATINDTVANALKLNNQLPSYFAKSENSLYYVQGNTTGTSGAWTGTIPDITELYVGLTIAYKIGVAGASTTNLNINNLGNKLVRRNTGNLTTHLPVGSVVILTYDGTYWVWADYGSDSNTYDRTYWGNTITAGAPIYSYKLLMQGLDGKFYPLTLETGTGTTKTVSTQEFEINSQILYYATTATVAANGTATNVYSEIPITTLSYTANQASWTSQQLIYLKGTILSNGNFKLDSTSYTSFMTQTLPTTADGFVYVLLGYMYSTTAMRLFQFHPMYEYRDGALRTYMPIHSHGNITDGGAIGSVSNKPIITGAGGILQVGSFGTSANTFAEGNHTHTTANITDAGTAINYNVGILQGQVPVLGSNGKLNESVLPALAITDTFVVNSQTTMLATPAEVGDVAIRTDVSKTYILKTTGANNIANWQELLTPTNAVTSVAGRTGNVSLVASDVGLGNVTNESKSTMFSNPGFTGIPTAPTATKGNNTTQIATTAFVQEAMGDKVDKVAGKGLSTNDFDNTYKSKIEANEQALDGVLTILESI